MPSAQTSNPSATGKAGLGTIIAHIAGVVGSDGFPTGERAVLRRMDPAHPPPLTFYRFALHHLPDDWEWEAAGWRTLVTGMAIMAPHIHQPDRGLGRALGEAGYSETRLERLLGADGETRHTLFLRAVRFLAAKGTPFNWLDGARLLLTREADKREQLHGRLATDFYRVLEQTQTH
jgi:CRISPR system Cascade subunit CasB